LKIRKHNQHVGVAVVLILVDNREKIMYPNYLTMTFDELMEHQRMITKKYNAAYNGGASQEVMNQMLGHMDAIRNAMWEIGYKESFKSGQDGDQFKDSIV